MQIKEALAAWHYANFRRYFVARTLLTAAIVMQSVVTGLIVYHHTHSTFQLGLVGLAEAIPAICIGLYAGYVADRYSRKKIIVASLIFLCFAAIAITYVQFHENVYYNRYGAVPIFLFTFCIGISRGFLSSATSAVAGGLVPAHILPNMIPWNTIGWYVGAIGGPAAGGYIYAQWGSGYACMCYTILFCLALVAYSLLQINVGTSHREAWWQSFKAGIAYLQQNKILLSAITLDLFAVMLGDAIILLPAFGAQVLHCNAYVLGWLRAAPAAGSIIMAMVLAFFPPVHHTGKKLLWAVAGFGLCMIAFGLSASIGFTFVALMLAGMFDTVSVVVRGIILQSTTPDNMRGRVSAINSIFIGSSNEIGAFVAGTMATWFTLQPSVVIGGFITIVVALTVASMVPSLLKYSQHMHAAKP